MMMTETRARRVTYQGDPALARALALMLEEEGARVRLRRPQATDDQRDLASMLQNVASGPWCGALRGDHHRGQQVPPTVPGAGGSVTIEGDHGGDD